MNHQYNTASRLILTRPTTQHKIPLTLNLDLGNKNPPLMLSYVQRCFDYGNLIENGEIASFHS
jgi:hypothetical protein